jgi:hypothetical protein
MLSRAVMRSLSFIVLAAIGACSTNTGESGTSSELVSILATDDGGVAPEPPDAAPPPPLACSRVTSDVCTDDSAACPYPSFANAVSARCSSEPHPKLTLLSCGVFDGAVEMQIDTSRTFYFEHGTGGKLIAIVWDVASRRDSRTCTAGPAKFSPPTCSAVNIGCPDASGVETWL